MKIASENLVEKNTPVKKIKHRSTWVDRTGMVYGRLTVIKFLGNDKYKHGRWLCQCSCGNKCVANSCLIGGHTNSCGCLKSDWTASKNFRHGQSERKNTTSEYRIWSGMKKRCGNSKSKAYHNYGGRGIKVCDRWLESFENFFEDVGPRPEGLTLDRIDNDLGYFKENCRWASYKDQANNTRTNKFVEFNGKTLSVSQWERELGFVSGTVKQRLYSGWPVERALTVPVRK